MPTSPLFVRRLFFFAGVYGVFALLPQYFLEGRMPDAPLAHPEHYYGFIGVALAWQLAMLAIARDPVRYRLMMLPAAFAKLSFVLAMAVLYGSGRLVPERSQLFFLALDLALGVLFLIAWQRTGEPA